MNITRTMAIAKRRRKNFSATKSRRDFLQVPLPPTRCNRGDRSRSNALIGLGYTPQAFVHARSYACSFRRCHADKFAPDESPAGTATGLISSHDRQ
jgi:hypothetical protein